MAVWHHDFSYGRALQDAALKDWAGYAAKVKTGQEALLHRAQCNGTAHSGKYSEKVEAASGSGAIAAASVSQD